MPLLEVHLWRACRPDFDPAIWLDLLSPDERTRAERFKFPVHRERFIVWRGILRTILGKYMGAAPTEIRFGQEEHGKPLLEYPTTDLRFNLSHSHDSMLLACARGAEIGVDLEHHDPRFQAEGIARRYFSEPEQEEILALPETQRLPAFLQIWTSHEAVLKAEGIGLAGLHTAAQLAAGWEILPFFPLEGFSGSLALRPGHRVTRWLDFRPLLDTPAVAD